YNAAWGRPTAEAAPGLPSAQRMQQARWQGARRPRPAENARDHGSPSPPGSNRCPACRSSPASRNASPPPTGPHGPAPTRPPPPPPVRTPPHRAGPPHPPKPPPPPQLEPMDQHPPVPGRHLDRSTHRSSDDSRRYGHGLVEQRSLQDRDLPSVHAPLGVPPRRCKRQVVAGAYEVDDISGGSTPHNPPSLRDRSAKIATSRSEERRV